MAALQAPVATVIENIYTNKARNEILCCKQRRRRSGKNELKVHVPQASSNPSWDFLSSEAPCRPSVKGLYWEILLVQKRLNFRLSSEWVRVCLLGMFQTGDVMQLLEDWWPEARMTLHQLASVVCRDK